ncbi:16S rRNA (cytosine(967)-C(5))-methyltransferase RsmB [Paenibacillus melissococcoides]|uniref:16S rRNA (cytosine(967)-C(5))-methyltransferase n=1 Tax=Paenibacillus melissococcoides TaxID=2912268 RepID=A0ABM9G6I3_9BACL|nr:MULTISPECIES: 16S rRNA (cytosine(967)-C(5))-methyltransferase RsmB [Paenibacillus]GIO77901.1 ribosomal RNA small subunit methyltransferase B [Paenibacillus dendritiformis]CAH8247298.1 16S rRNA (cytosine(967)-C(5))-methyltransferase RsmB [Paenibacillus melissococcoides]CAH8717295.1 16S rRNA (cytosine(967)-C(5))-methyltransferase RsmB [Paenibacillus melissococcoides]CAH8718284.1 16S rRNA (cytosine(967)-C(5))-methyltransferase RsmB [Paenibacillus melissococcoides]
MTARDVALEVLVRVEKEGSYSNLELNRALKVAQLERADAGLATELVYGTIQRLNTIDGVLARKVQRGLAKLKPWVRNLLRMTAYQLRYLDRVPPHAAVNEAVAIAKRRGQQAMGGFVNGVLRAIMREPELWDAPPADGAVSRIAWEHSHPEWLVARWIAAYGEAETAAMCAANNQPPHGSARVNRLRGTREALLGEMRADGYRAEASALSPDGIVAAGAGNLAHSAWYRDGRLSVQDESSMLVVEALRPEPGMRVLDCCAAPGGKSTHIAERMGDRGEVTANDVHAHKVALIEEQAARLGLTSLRVLNVDAAELGQALPPASFDAVLLDAPCTGFGVIRRKPDIKWAKREEDVAAIAALQERLLAEAARMVRPGGRLVYSTCTVEPEENEDAVRRFLERTPGWALDASWTRALPQDVLDAALRRSPAGMLQVLPQDAGSDGFFIACLQRTDGPEEAGPERN